MQVGLVLSACLVLNSIQTLCLFNGAFPKVPRHFHQQPHTPLGELMPLFSSPRPSPLEVQRPSSWTSSNFMPKRGLGISLNCWFLVFSCFIIKERKSRRKKEEKDQRKDQRVDRDPSFIQICRLIFFGKEKSILRRLFQVDPE